MKSSHPYFLALALCLPTAGFAQAGTLALPAPSVWKLNPAASTGAPASLSPDSTLTINSFSKGAMNLSVHLLGANGKPLDVTFNGAPDGRPHRYAGGAGSFRDDGVYTFEQTDGTHEYGTLKLSPDGKTLTNTYTVKPRLGAGSQVVSVYNRVR